MLIIRIQSALLMVCVSALAIGCAASVERLPAGSSVSGSGSLETKCELLDEASGCAMWGPSLLELIARPELFDGKRVRVIGFVNFEFEGNGLYVSREDWQHSVYRNGLWIDTPPTVGGGSETGQGPNRTYVIVEGTFSAKDTGHMGMWSGAIQNVTRLDSWR